MEETFYLSPERIPVFIGKEGSKKKEFENEFSCELSVDSQSGKVSVECEDAVNAFVMGHVIEAVNLGHNPLNTFVLKEEHIVFDVIDIKSHVRNSSRVASVSGRIIGKNGSTRRAIEEITKCSMAVSSDNVVSVIGEFENVELVHQALTMLIQGASHKTIYSYLERNKV